MEDDRLIEKCSRLVCNLADRQNKMLWLTDREYSQNRFSFIKDALSDIKTAIGLKTNFLT